MSALLDLVLPPACPVCRRFLPLAGGPLCPRCVDDTGPVAPAPTPAGRPRFAAAAFDGRLRQAILALKFRDEAWRGRPLGRFLGLELPTAGLDCDLVVPVPLHRSRLRARGFDQAAEIAHGVASTCHGRAAVGRLRRLVGGAPQSARSLDERRLIERTYAADRVAGLRVLLVDDVTTSGHTLDACADALVEAGASAVTLAAVAYTLPDPADETA